MSACRVKLPASVRAGLSFLLLLAAPRPAHQLDCGRLTGVCTGPVLYNGHTSCAELAPWNAVIEQVSKESRHIVEVGQRSFVKSVIQHPSSP